MKKTKEISLKELNLNNAEEKRNFNKKLFTIVAPKYGWVTRILSFGRDQTWKKKMLKKLPKEGVSNILDLACGTGDIVQKLIKKYPDAYVWGLDLNEEMLKIARKNIKNDHVQFLLKDMQETGFGTASVDVVTGGYALRNAPDLHSVLDEVFRILKKGGKAYFLDFSKSSWKWVAWVQFKLLSFWGGLWGILLHGKSYVYRYIAHSLKAFPNRKMLQEISLNAGFRNIISKKYFFGFVELLILEK